LDGKWSDENISEALNKLATGCPNLREFQLGGCSAALHECLNVTLPKWTSLQSLVLMSCNHHIESFITGTLPSLKVLWIYNYSFCNNISGMELSHACPALETCNFFGEISDSALLKIVETCSNLLHLYCKGNSMKHLLRKLGLSLQV
jgi:hypothetical protein